MMKRLISTVLLTVILLTVSTFAFAQHSEDRVFENWTTGKVVDKAQVDEYGVDKCFVMCDIGEKLFRRIYGLSYKKNCSIPVRDLVYLKVLHRDCNGSIKLGEMICNRRITSDLLEIFRTLYDAKYPIERMELVDNYGADDNRSMAANNSSAFNFRYIAGTTRLSRHSLGMAVDINPLYNPYVRTVGGRVVVEPEAAQKFADRTAAFAYKIDTADLCCQEFLRHGFTWGGNWSDRKDYQHFEKK